MAFKAWHDVDLGIRRLLLAPQDVSVRDPIPWREPPISRSAATVRHQALYDEYTEFLEEALLIGEGWWDDMVEAAIHRGASPDDAVKEVQSRLFAGPAARGEVIWTVRTFWLKCAALNREVKPEQRVPPQVLLLAWLAEENRAEWVEMLTAYPYWPIGLDQNREWV